MALLVLIQHAVAFLLCLQPSILTAVDMCLLLLVASGSAAAAPALQEGIKKHQSILTKMPPSLSNIQWDGALSLFMCFFGPRTYAKPTKPC
jgi:hypothetical protein